MMFGEYIRFFWRTSDVNLAVYLIFNFPLHICQLFCYKILLLKTYLVLIQMHIYRALSISGTRFMLLPNLCQMKPL